MSYHNTKKKTKTSSLTFLYVKIMSAYNRLDSTDEEINYGPNYTAESSTEEWPYQSQESQVHQDTDNQEGSVPIDPALLNLRFGQTVLPEATQQLWHNSEELLYDAPAPSTNPEEPACTSSTQKHMEGYMSLHLEDEIRGSQTTGQIAPGIQGSSAALMMKVHGYTSRTHQVQLSSISDTQELQSSLQAPGKLAPAGAVLEETAYHLMIPCSNKDCEHVALYTHGRSPVCQHHRHPRKLKSSLSENSTNQEAETRNLAKDESGM